MANIVAKDLGSETKLYLGRKFFDFGLEGAIAVANTLMTNSTLRYINLEMNMLEDKGAIIIAEMLKVKIPYTCFVLPKDKFNSHWD